MRHGKAFASTMAFFMYEECAEGKLNPDWKVDSPMSMKQFRAKLSRQKCEYSSYKCDYPGGDKLRATKKSNKVKRGRKQWEDNDGRAKCDCEMLNIHPNNYTRPTKEDRERNDKHIRELRMRFWKEQGIGVGV